MSFETPCSITHINSSTFEKCTSLKQIIIPSSVIRIDEKAFYQCSSLAQVSFEKPSSLVSIGEYAFYDCDSLRKVSIPPSVTKMEGWCFSFIVDITRLKE